MSMTIADAIKRIRAHMAVHRIGVPPHIHIKEALDMAIDALQEKLKRERGCKYCTDDRKTFPTHCDGEANIVLLIPLPAIDLNTGEIEDTADPPFFTIRIQSDEMGEDFVPIRCCPMCGRLLKKED